MKRWPNTRNGDDIRLQSRMHRNISETTLAWDSKLQYNRRSCIRSRSYRIDSQPRGSEKSAVDFRIAVQAFDAIFKVTKAENNLAPSFSTSRATTYDAEPEIQQTHARYGKLFEVVPIAFAPGSTTLQMRLSL